MSRYREYTIQPGDTLARIASRFGVSPNAIFQASDFRSGNPNVIYVGETARVPQNPDDPSNQIQPREAIPDTQGDDEVSVIINGVIFTGWAGVEITRAIDTAASGFAISGPFDPDRSELVEAFEPYSYNQCNIYIGRDLVITGTIESIDVSLAATSRAISTQGRSLPGVLLDCNIDPTGWEFAGLTLAQLARQLCQPFGISVQLEGPDTGAIAELRAEPGQRYFDFLKSVADARGKLITDNPQGSLVIRTETASGSPVASLVEGESPVVSVSAQYDGTQRFSKYTVMTQFAGTPDLSGVASDRGVRAYRPFAKVGSTAEFESIETAAEWERSLGLSRSIQVSVTVSGWRNNSGVWNRGQIVTLLAPSAFVMRDTRFVVAQVTLRIDESGGRVSSLRLVLPETYAGGLPDRYPWEPSE